MARSTAPMTLREAAAVLGVSAKTLRNQAVGGKIAATKRGRDWFVDPREVDRYGREQRRAS